MRLVIRERVGSSWLAVALCWVSLNAHAAPSANDKAASEGLFQEGKTLLEQGNYEQACAKFAASQELDAGFGTLMNLGDCFEKRRMTASAWVTFKEAASSARAQGQADREAAARERASALESRLSKLVIHMPSGAADLQGLEVRLNQTSLPRAVWGARVPVDPGTQRLEIRAPGYRPFVREISVADAAEIVVDVPSLEPEPVAPTAPAGPSASSEGAEASRSSAMASSHTTQRTLGFVIGGAGVVGLAIGSVFGLSAISKNDDSNSNGRCSENACDAEGLAFREEAKDAASISTVAFVAGGVLAVGGLTLVLMTPRSDAPPAASGARAVRARMSVTPLAGGAGLRLGGSF